MKAEMSEVDRLSNSGLYPILPMGDRKGQRDEAGHPPPGDPKSDSKAKDANSLPDPPRPPKSLIDEYA